MAVAAQQDAGFRPATTDASDEASQMAAHLDARRRLAGAQDNGDRPAPIGVVDVDRQEAALVVMGIEQRQLLMAMDDIAGIVDVERDGTRRLWIGIHPRIDERICQPDHILQAGRVFEPRQSRLRTEVVAGVWHAPAGELERRIMAQVVEVVGVLVAHRNSEDARSDHVGERVGDASGIATIGSQTRQTIRDGEPALGHGQQHDAAIRGQTATIKIGCDLLGSNGRKRERRDRIVGHGGRGWSDESRTIGLSTQILRCLSCLSYARQPSVHRSMNKKG